MTEQALSARFAPQQSLHVRGATLRAVLIIWYRDVLRMARDRPRIIVSLAQPLLYLLIFGTGLSSSLRGATAGFGGRLNYQQFMFPGVIGMAVLFTSMFGAMSILWDREFGFLKEVLVSPINRSAVAVGKTLGSATQAMVQGFIILALAPVVGVQLTVTGVLELIPMIFVLAFALSALGVAFASRMRSLQAFQMVMNFLMMPIFFLAGALFPLSNLPGWMTVLTRLDPATYGIDPIRRASLGASGVPHAVLDRFGITILGQTLSLWTEELILAGFALLMLAAAVRGFRQRD